MSTPIDRDETLLFGFLVGNGGNLALVRTQTKGQPVAVIVDNITDDDGDPAMMPLALLLTDDLVELLEIQPPLCERCGEPTHVHEHT